MATGTSLRPVAVADVDGVTVKRRSLDLAVARMFRNARRIGRRLERFLREYPDDPPAGWVLWAADYEQRFVFSALKEQRERAKLTPKTGAALLSDEEYEAALGDLVRASLDKMSELELEQLLAERRKPKPIEVP